MQYINIAKGLEEIATNANGAILADHIASGLGRKSKAQVTAINQALNFNFPLFRTRPTNADRIITVRRAAMLVSKTFDTLPAVPPRGGASPSESWDEMELEMYIAQQRQKALRNPTPSGPPGPYLAASFWAYSTEDERSTALAGYQEALELCTFGLLAATHATRASPVGPSQRGVDIYADLVAVWFGTAPGIVETVRSNLHKTLTGLKTNYIRMGYAGRNARAIGGVEIKETCFTPNGADLGSVRPIGNGEFAYAPSEPLKAMHKFVLCELFFDAQNTTVSLADEIVAIGDENKMDVTRSGTIVHEATHMYARTIDVELKDDVYDHAGWTRPAAGGTKRKGYGLQPCLALARVSPAEAVKNADNYRIFCEAAKYHRQHAGAPVVIR